MKNRKNNNKILDGIVEASKHLGKVEYGMKLFDQAVKNSEFMSDEQKADYFKMIDELK